MSPLRVCHGDLLQRSSDLVLNLPSPTGWKALFVFLEQILLTFSQMESSSCSPRHICNMNGNVITEEDYDPPHPSTVSEKVSKLSHMFVIKRIQKIAVFPLTTAHNNKLFEHIK